MRCCTCGRGSATTRARATCIGPRVRIRDEHGGEFPPTLRADRGAAGHRPLDRRRDPRAVPRRALPDPRRQRAARAGALLRRRGSRASRSPRREAAVGAGRALHPAAAGSRVHPGHHGSRRDGVRAAQAPVQRMPAERRLLARAAPAASTSCPRRAAHSCGARRRAFMVVALADSQQVWLERRPESGVWGGLWCLPEFATATAAAAFIRNSLRPLRSSRSRSARSSTRSRTSISPSRRCWCIAPERAAVMEEGGGLWYNLREPARIGLPAPITALLSRSGRRDAVRCARGLSARRR